MPKGQKRTLSIPLTHEQRAQLQQLASSRTTRGFIARRARMILLYVEGKTVEEIISAVGMTRTHVYKWVHRFLEAGVAGLADKRKGKPARST